MENITVRTKNKTHQKSDVEDIKRTQDEDIKCIQETKRIAKRPYIEIPTVEEVLKSQRPTPLTSEDYVKLLGNASLGLNLVWPKNLAWPPVKKEDAH